MDTCGKASWYEFTTKTASGERANPEAMTAAHRTLPFGTQVLVTNLRNGRTVSVRINDRGPFIRGRIIDVTRRAARELDFKRAGWAPVRIVIKGAPVKGAPKC
ncbi:septal ring lytic transglycosylase RlpA family protein [Breoghania sp. L-A4]|uniref:septal ring lytic transglycosylase RlpA family protein n=1 Tax=Breoghania sp. L-A4 TaxID=2304600 RepID=UPI000E35C3D6|nr:septal ring lytic transglycosylase RlpA family protein [Breoghania sp. L-A4]AXS41423.1 septal ring lytic transglycosylase RlpA family protein [Breoghania sp. L-A4]